MRVKLSYILLCLVMVLELCSCGNQAAEDISEAIEEAVAETSTDVIIGSSAADENLEARSLDENENASLYSGYSNVDGGEKKVITIGTLSQNGMLESAVSQFNASSNEYTAEIELYDSQTVMNTKILAGDGPDVIYLSGFSYLQYIQRDIFLDVSELLDEADDYESTIRQLIKDDFSDQIAISSYYFDTISLSDSILEGRRTWTFDEFLELADTLNIYQKRTKDFVLNFYLKQNVDVYIDMENYACNFECDEFYNAMAFINRFLTSESQIVDDGNAADIIFSATVSEVEELFDAEGGDSVYMGFPSDTGHGIAISSIMSFAIPYSAADIEGAEEFIRFTLSDDFQTSIELGFPVSHSAMLNLIEERLSTEEYAEYPEAVEQATSTALDLLSRTTDITYEDSTILDIIEEEVASYFNGDKAIEDVAQIIQNRVQTYLDEQA